jgi:cytidine deaminase
MPSPPSKRATRERLLEAARAAMKNAYAPYSKFRVGAALLTVSGDLFTGCNVENSSYGVTNCAERTAVFSAITRLGPTTKIRAIAVVNNQNAPCSPCGACRQVIYEFGPKASVIFLSASGWKDLPIEKLLPQGFRLQ